MKVYHKHYNCTFRKKKIIFSQVHLKIEILYNFYDNVKNDQIQNVSIPLDLETLNLKGYKRERKVYTARWEMGNVSVNHLLPSRSSQFY